MLPICGCFSNFSSLQETKQGGRGVTKKVEYGQVGWASVKPTLSLDTIIDLEGEMLPAIRSKGEPCIFNVDKQRYRMKERQRYVGRKTRSFCVIPGFHKTRRSVPQGWFINIQPGGCIRCLLKKMWLPKSHNLQSVRVQHCICELEALEPLLDLEECGMLKLYSGRVVKVKWNFALTFSRNT